MKSGTAHIVFAFLLLLVITSCKMTTNRKSFDQRVTLRQKDKIPYGMAAAKELLPSMFSRAAVYTDDRSPGYWNTISSYSNRQAVIFVAKRFNAEDYELRR